MNYGYYCGIILILRLRLVANAPPRVLAMSLDSTTFYCAMYGYGIATVMLRYCKYITLAVII